MPAITKHLVSITMSEKVYWTFPSMYFPNKTSRTVMFLRMYERQLVLFFDYIITNICSLQKIFSGIYYVLHGHIKLFV